MDVGFILILSVLFVGGVIATVGDRLGTRVGKARLSLFKLRPRRTATLVTIMTGIVIAASTLGILFAASESLREGVFELEKILRNLRRTRGELQQARDQKAQIETELSKARSDRTAAEKELASTNQSLKTALTERSRAQAETSRTQTQLQRTQTQLQRTQAQLSVVSQQISKLRQEANQLEIERNRVIVERDQSVAQRDRATAQRDQVIAQLQQLEAQQGFLEREVLKLERERQGLRQGNVAIQRGQVLATAVLRIVAPSAATQAVDQLLREANRAAIQMSRPGADGQIIQITRADVEKLINKIDDGQDYVVRIFSAANYLIGETPIQVFADAIRNQVVFPAGEVVATSSLDPSTMTGEQIQQRINLLIAAANFRARSLGMLSDSVQIGRIQNLISFIEQLKQYNQTVELRAIAAEVTYTSGPLKLEFIAAQNGQILFGTANGQSTNQQSTVEQ
jgi:uncharacterized protein (DUF3084 family)